MSTIPSVFFDSSINLLKAAGYEPVHYQLGTMWFIKKREPLNTPGRPLRWRGSGGDRVVAIADLLPYLRGEA